MKVLLFILVACLATSVGAFEHINRLLESLDDENLRRRLLSKPKHMLHKAEKHLATNKESYQKKKAEDLTSFNQGNRFIPCQNGATNCKNMDIETYIFNEELGCDSTRLIGFSYINDLWGWVDPETNKEYALVGMFDGTSIVDISKPKKPVVLGFIDTAGDLPPGDFSGFWRDIKVVNNVAYITAEVAGHGLQVFDLTRLRDMESPKLDLFKAKNADDIPIEGDVPRITPDLVIDSIGAAHNVVQFPEMNKILAVGLSADAMGTPVCDIGQGEAVAVWDVSDPLNPVFETCLSGSYNICFPGSFCSYDGYVHDGQCFIYDGPDADYTGVPMCVFFAETEVVLFNMDTYEQINKFTWADAAYGKWYLNLF
jgi:choice-of-anchor B domain-containing protein